MDRGSWLARLAVLGFGLVLGLAAAGCANSSSAPGQARVQETKPYLFTNPADGGGGSVQILIAMKNIGNAPAQLGSSTWTLYDKLNNSLDSGDLTALTPYLKAGETGYLGGYSTLRNDSAFRGVDRVDASLTWNTVAAIPAQKLTTNDVTVVGDDMGLWLKATGTVTNSGSAAVSKGQICIVLMDVKGEPVGWLEDETTADGLGVGQTKGFQTSYPWPAASLYARIRTFKIYATDLSSQ